MSISRSLPRPRLGALALLLALCPSTGFSQSVPAAVSSVDTVEIVAGPQYKAGGLKRFFFGSGYRDLWTTPLRVPVLNLQTFAGGLRPVKAGGGFQTKSLRLITPDGVQYVFRSVDKPGVMLLPGFEGTVIEMISHDQVFASWTDSRVAGARPTECMQPRGANGRLCGIIGLPEFASPHLHPLDRRPIWIRTWIPSTTSSRSSSRNRASTPRSHPADGADRCATARRPVLGIG